MPYIIKPHRVRNVVAALSASALLIGAVPAVAGAACPSSPTSQAFAQFGDEAAYTLVEGGTFESGAPGWSLSGASVESENEVLIPTGDRYALKIRPRGRATSPGFCVSSEYPSFRFLFRKAAGWGGLNVGLAWTDESGSHYVSVGWLHGGGSWALSPVLELAGNLPLTGAESTITPVHLVFEGSQPGQKWAISDVYIDPYSR
ncbi:MAG TPA: hypothetical protein VKG38_07330 [Solirubrobacteraceae bacterium]|nr:hypothetical protein [Solirubrobacteraceae bacterium]